MIDNRFARLLDCFNGKFLLSVFIGVSGGASAAVEWETCDFVLCWMDLPLAKKVFSTRSFTFF